jgi:microcystin-dependent protein
MSTPFMSELRIISWNFPPKGWAFANGQFLPINQNQALFSLLGTMYGGNGQTTFALPDLRGRTPIHTGQGFTLGQAAGEVNHTLSIQELPQHNHFVNTTNVAGDQQNPTNNFFANSNVQPFRGDFNTTLGPETVTNVGGSQPHNNMSPFLVLNIIIALQGAFPSRN